MEIWKSVKGYEGLYDVSNLGNVISLRFNKKKVLKQQINGGGYFHVILCFKRDMKTRTVHQLVAESFLNFTQNGHNLVVNHKNFIKTDNRVENLEIVTQRENANKKHIKSYSKYTGVTWHKNNKKWISQIVINGKLNFLGVFTNEIEASNAYQLALKNLCFKTEV